MNWKEFKFWERKKRLPVSPGPIDRDPNTVAEKIYTTLLSPEPCMIAQFGAVEFGCIVNYLGLPQNKRWRQAADYRIRKAKGWSPDIVEKMNVNAGFFPPTEECLEQFCLLMIQDIPYVDILASWRPEELYFEKELKNAYKIDFEPFNPFWNPQPWTRALENKTVLVIHPYAETITKQYEKRESLHVQPHLLPKFNLLTIKAVQSIGGEPNQFNNWFEALEYMKTEINKLDFDICLIGCGAYGFPLAAHVKRMGRKAVHLGGSLQLIFGIRGRRWEDSAYNDKYNYSKLMNEYWVRPSESEMPAHALKVENGCYW